MGPKGQIRGLNSGGLALEFGLPSRVQQPRRAVIIINNNQSPPTSSHVPDSVLTA